MRGCFRLFKIGRAGVYVSFMIFLTVIFMYTRDVSLPGVISSAVSTIALILIHELGHWFFAKRLKYDVSAIVLHPFGGFCVIENPDNERDHAVISWGGIVFQIALLLPAIACLIAFGYLGFTDNLIYTIIYERFFGLNIFLIVVNLLPFPLFDGELAWKFFKYVKINIPKKRGSKKAKLNQDEKKAVEKIVNDMKTNYRV